MNSIAKLALLAAASAILVGCAGKYGDVKKVNGDFAKATQSYVDDLETAKDADAVVKAMDRYGEQLETLWPKMQALSEKYPELKDAKNLPKDLAELQKESEAVGMKMAGTFMKIAPYMRDPEVRKAQERLGKIMGGE